MRHRVYRVNGDSMSPWARSGDYLVLGRFLPRHAEPGRVVVVAHADLGIIVKRIVAVSANGGMRLAGDAAASTSPDTIGLVHGEQVIGRVLLRIRAGASACRRSRAARRPSVSRTASAAPRDSTRACP